MSPAAPSYREKPPKLVAGALCLDFVNTESWRGDPEDKGERLTSYAELLLWAVHARVLDKAAGKRLAAEAERHPQAAAALVRAAVELRGALAALFLAPKRAPAAALAVLNARLAAAPARSALRASGSGFAWEGAGADDALERLLWPILWSAADLLTSGQHEHVRACGEPRCSWLFLDPSPSGRRRWCSMKECGNRAKVRRHHRAHLARGRQRSTR